MSLLETTPTGMVVEEVVNVDSVDEHDTDDKTEDTTKEVVQLDTGVHDTDAKNETEVLEESVHLETAVLEEETGVTQIEEEAETSSSVSEKEEEEEKVNNASEEEPEPEKEVSTSIEKKEVKVTSLSVGCPVLIQEPSIGKNVYNKNLTQGQMMYKTLKEIRKCNTRRIVDQFENLCF